MNTLKNFVEKILDVADFKMNFDMNTKEIKSIISINAPKKKVWDVLLNGEYNRIWYAEFSEGTHAITDWALGSKVQFIDSRKTGIVGEIIENKPYEVLSIEYNGSIKDGKEDFESDEAKSIKGIREIYHLSGNNDVTELSISCGMDEAYFEDMSLLWEKALQKIKGLSESQ